MPSDTDIAWAAGLFEGEGTCGAYRSYYTTKAGTRNRRKTPQRQLAISMTDFEPIERFASIFGLVVYGPYAYNGYKPQWRVHANGKKTIPVLEALLPYLSPRRRERAESVIRGDSNSVPE